MGNLPDNLDFYLYFNLFFLALIALSMLFGFLRGLRNSTWALGVRVLFYVLFFVTLTPMANFLWNANLDFALRELSGVVPEISGASSLSEALPAYLQATLGDNLESTLTNPEFVAFTEGLAIFVVKILYFLLYFTVFKILYTLIFFIVRLLVLPKRRKKKTWANRGLGAAVGFAGGLVSVYVFLIFFGGVMDIADSTVSIINMGEEEAHASDVHTLSEESQDPLFELDEDVEEIVAALNDFVDGYNRNPLVQVAFDIRVTDDAMEDDLALHLYLFDMIYSFEYREQQISFRKELSIVAEITGMVLENDYMETNDFADVSGDDIRALFNKLSESDMFTAILPLGVEIGADFYDVELSEDVKDELYSIAWDEEISQLGAIAALAFDIVYHAGVLEDDPDYETVVFDGDEIRDLFGHLSESKLVTLSAWVAIEPVLEAAGENAQAVVSVPEGLEWEDEFKALGALIGEIVDTGVTLGELQDGDLNVLFQTLSGMDTTVALDSLLISHALKNILSGEGDFEALDILIVHDEITWFDELDDDGETILEKGELRYLLLAVNELMRVASEFDFDDFRVEDALNIDEQAFDALMDSDILAHTAGNQIMELGEDMLTIPSVAKATIAVNAEDKDIVNRAEIRKIYDAVMALDFEDLDFDEIDTIILESLGTEEDPTVLDEEKANTLLASDILHATLSTTILDMTEDEEAEDFLTVPHYAEDDQEVRSMDTEDDIEYISRDEFINLLRAVLALDLGDFDQIDAIGLDKITANIDILLDSAILHATVSKQLIDMSDDPEEDVLIVPYFTQDNAPIRFTVGSGEKSVEYILKDELVSVVEAIDIIGDFDDFDDFDPDINLENLEEEENRDAVLSSSILQATISKQLFDLDEDETVAIPYYRETFDETDPDDESQWVRKRVGDAAEGTDTEYIMRDELDNVLVALIALDMLDFEEFEGEFELERLEEEDNRNDVLASAILQATISKQLIDLEDEGTVVVPYFTEDFDSADPDNLDHKVRLTAGVSTDGNFDDEDTRFEYILATELDAVLLGMIALDLLDVDAFDGDVDLAELSDNEKRADVLSSSVLQATISNQLFEQEEGVDSTIVVPYLAEDDLTPIRIRVGEAIEETDFEYVSRAELDSIILAMIALDITDVGEFDGDVDLAELSDPEKRADVLSSSVLQATMTDQLFDQETDGNITVPYYNEDYDDDPDDDNTWVRKPIGLENDARFDDEDTRFEYILINELDSIILAMIALDITDVTTFDGNVDLGLLEDPAKRADVLSSAILQATITDQIYEQETLGNLVAPYYRETFDGDPDDEGTWVRKPIGLDTDARFDDEDTRFEYILRGEIDAMILAMIALDITDIDTFDGVVDLGLLDDENRREDVLASAVLQATITDKILEQATLDNLEVPYYKETYDGDPDDEDTWVRKPIGLDADARFDDGDTRFEYVIKDEIDAMILAMLALDITDIDAFDGVVDLTLLEDEGRRDDVTASTVLQATITDQIREQETLGNVTVPYYRETYDEDTPTDEDTWVRKDSGLSADSRFDDADTRFEFILSEEIDSIILAMLALDITDIDDFAGTVAFENLDDATKRSHVLSSAIIQATMTDQLFDLETAGDIALPHYRETYDETDPDNEATWVRKIVGDSGAGTEFEYVLSEELDLIIQSLIVLDIADIEAFDGTVGFANLELDANRETVLSSAMIQATMTKQLFDLESGGTLDVPHYDRHDTDLVRKSVGDSGAGTEFEYIVGEELDYVIVAMITLELTDIDDFTGTISLSVLDDPDPATYEDNRHDVLNSSILHATISKQLFDLDDGGDIAVPHYESYLTEPANMMDIALRIYTGDTLEGTHYEYVVFDELDQLIKVMNILGVNDVQDFDGSISLSAIVAQGQVDDVLASHIIHATISEQLTDLDGLNTIEVPHREENNTTVIRRLIGLSVDDNFDDIDTHFEYVRRNEISDMIYALDMLGIDDIQTYDGEISLSTLFEDEANIDTLLESAILQATLSQKMFDDTGGLLIIPDENVNTGQPVRIDTDDRDDNFDFTYVESGEMRFILLALDQLELTDLENLNFEPATIFKAGEDDYETVLDSASLQATISDNILEFATDETSAPALSTTLIVTDYFREAIAIDGAADEHIEKEELRALLTALETLDINSFEDDLDPTVIQGLEDAELYELLESGSIHITLDDMLQANDDVEENIPDYGAGATALKDEYNETDILFKDEIVAFINAADILGGGAADFTNVTLDYNTILNLDETEREIVLESMIVREFMTEPLEGAYFNETGSAIDDVHYMNEDSATFLTKDGALHAIETVE